MARQRIQVEIAPTKFIRQETAIVDGFEIVRGDIIKIKGQHGIKFKFDSFTTNSETGSQWVDCFEIQGGTASCFRAFRLEEVKRIPQKRKRAKRVV